jgi:hypothetical protein
MSWRAHVTAAHTISSSPAVDGSALPPHAPISSATDPLPMACTSPSTFNALLPLYRRRTAATSHQRSLVVLPLLASRVQLIAKVGYCTSSNMATTDGPWTRAGKEQTNSNRGGCAPISRSCSRAHLTHDLKDQARWLPSDATIDLRGCTVTPPPTISPVVMVTPAERTYTHVSYQLVLCV